MNAEIQNEFSIYLADRPGELAGVLEAAAAANVEVTALAITNDSSRGIVRLLGQPEDGLRRLCESLADTGVGPVVEAPVLVLYPAERASTLRDLTARFADGRINVQYGYAAPAHNGQPARCVLRVDDLDRAIQLVRESA